MKSYSFSLLMNTATAHCKPHLWINNLVLLYTMQGQSKIADHLKKSYSMNDISRDPDENEMRRYRKDSLDEIEDETGTSYIHNIQG